MSDNIDDVVTILQDDWIAANTDNLTPTIGLVESYKRIDLGSIGDYVLLYGSPANIKPIGLGYGSESNFQSISIDIRTTVSKARLVKLLNEAKRVIHANRRRAQNGVHDLIVVERITPLSNKTIKLWRFILEVSVRDFAVSIT